MSDPKAVNEPDKVAAVGDLDISRAPLGVKSATALVSAVAGSDDRIERHYLEVKSDLDFSQKNDIAKIAKFILGAANRMPEVASAAFEGYGVMVIGVGPGEITGVPPVEVLDLDQTISRYIGTSGPRWDLVRVPVAESSNEVLVILVDPPRDGQDPFVCRKEGDKLFDGRVYVRADGATREAKADELDRLIQRGKSQPAPDVSFAVEVVGTARPLAIDDERTVDAHIEETTSRLLGALPSVQAARRSANLPPGMNIAANALRQAALADQSAQSALARFNSYMTEPEDRTEEEFRESLANWEAKVRSQWVAAVDELAGRVLGGVSVRVSNATKTFFHEVEAKIHIEGDVRGIAWRHRANEDASIDLNIPRPPRKWGPRTRSLVSPAMLNASHYMPASDFSSSYTSPLEWNNSGSIDLALDVGELRPRGSFESDDDELVLVLPSEGVANLRGTWEITARDHNEIYTGQLTVSIGEPLDLTDAVRRILELD